MPRLKYLLIDISKIPDKWEMDKFMQYMKAMKIPVKDLDGFRELELDVTLWQYLKFKLGITKWSKQKND